MSTWYYAKQGQQLGPVSLEKMRQLRTTGAVSGSDLVWTETMANWEPADTVTELGGTAAPAYDVSPAYRSPAPTALAYQTQGYHPLSYQTQSIVNYAGFWARFAAALIDGIIVAVVNFVLAFALGMIAGLAGGNDPEVAELVAGLVGQVGGLIIGWLYEALQLSSIHQATIGKRALSIYVSDMTGERISFGRATGRHFGKIISGIICMAGYIMQPFNERKQALHDMMAGTLVLQR